MKLGWVRGLRWRGEAFRLAAATTARQRTARHGPAVQGCMTAATQCGLPLQVLLVGVETRVDFSDLPEPANPVMRRTASGDAVRLQLDGLAGKLNKMEQRFSDPLGTAFPGGFPWLRHLQAQLGRRLHLAWN